MCSEDYSRLWQCFEVLYKDSRYFDYLNERKSKYEDYLYVAVYRAVVYACTAYIAKKFIKYTSEKLGLSLCFNMEFMHENAGKEFFDAANWMLNKSEFVEWEKRFVLLAKQQIFSASNPKNTGTSTVIAEVYQECLYNAYDKLIEAKRKKPDMLLSIEELIEIVRQNAGNASDKVIKYYVVSILLQFLDLSITGNKLKLGENNRIIRGFKAGENSEISLPYGNSYFYYAIYEFYQFLSKQYGEESESYFQTFYESFVSGLYNLFMNNQYMDSIITMKEFILLKKYYKEAKERLKEVILNKKVVFENSNMDNLVLIDIQRYIKGFQLN